MGFFGFFIIQKWLINDPWSIAIFFETFLERPKMWLNMTRRYHQNISKNTRTCTGTSLEHILFISENLKLWKRWQVCALGFSNFLFWILIIWSFENSKNEIWAVEHLKLESWKMWNMTILKFCNLKMKIELCKLEIRKFEIEHLKSFKWGSPQHP